MSLTVSGTGIQGAKILNSLILISVVLSIILFLPPIWFYALVVLAIGKGLDEFYNLLARIGIPCYRRLGIVLGMAMGLAFTSHDSSMSNTIWLNMVETTLLLTLFGTAITALFRQDLLTVIASLSGTVFGILYVGFLAGYLIALRKISNGANFASLAFIVTWARDAGAYAIGSFFNRGRVLFSSISPHKTFEGAIGGLVFAVVFAILAKIGFLFNPGYLHFIIIGLLLGVLGQLGDLVESMLKRGAGVKDAGNILPLHGGILDRIDGLLFTAPMLYYYVRLFMLK